MSGELSNQGYVKLSPEQIRDQLIAKIREKIPEFSLKPADLQSNLINTAVEDLVQYEDETEIMLNAIAPGFANDMLIKKFAESIGLRQNKKFNSSVILTFSGPIGTFIPKGTSCSGAGHSFTTVTDILLPSTGSKTVLAESEDMVAIAAGNIDTIDSLNIGGLSVINEVDGIIGVPQESLQQLKYRMQARFRSPRKGGVDYAYSVLTTNLKVDPRLIKFRVLPNENSFNRAIECVVGGGLDEDVALALFQGFLETQKLVSQPSEGESFRTVSINILYYGNTIPIEFTRPKNLNIDIILKISFSDIVTTPTSIKGIVEDTLTEHINTLKLGSPLSKLALTAIILPLLQQKGLNPDTITSIDYNIKIGGQPVTYYTGQESDPELRKKKGQIKEIMWDTYLTLTSFAVEVEAV